MQDNKVYAHTYFRVDAGYVWGEGMPDEQLDRFNADLQKVLTPIGFQFKEPKMRHDCYKCARGAESLYCHPMDISGYVLKESVPEIESVLKNATAFKLRAVDTYEEALNYTSEEFSQELLTKKEEIESLLLNAFRTKRKNLFRSDSAMLNLRLGMKYFSNNSALKEIESQFINQTFVDLVRREMIATAKTRIGTAYRTTKIVNHPRLKSGACGATRKPSL